MRLIKSMALTLIAAFLCVGCGPQKPAGVPDLSSASVSIVKGSNPVVKANVFLVPLGETPSGSWTVMGVTDEKGAAVITTSQGEWKAPGAPAGEYSVYITKVAEIEEPEIPADIETNEAAKSAYFAERLKRLQEAGNEIPKSLTSNDTSDLKITVASGSGTSETFDIAQYDK